MFKNSSYKSKIFFYLIVFAITILLSLWFFQVVFLNSYYEKYKTKELLNVLEELKEHYLDDSFYDLIDEIAYKRGICAEITSSYETLYTTDFLNRGCLINDKSGEVLHYKRDFIRSSNDEYLKIKINNKFYDNVTLLYGAKLNSNLYVFVNTSLDPIDSTIIILKNQLIIVSIVVLSLAIVIAYLISKKFSSPIIKLTKEAKKLAGGDFKINFETDTDIIEVKELANTLNYTKEVLEKNDELRRDLMANVGHDLKTPLTMIKAYAEMVRDLTYKDKKKREANLDIIIEEVDRLSLLVNDILSLSKLESNIEIIKKEKFDLVQLTNDILNRFKIFSYTLDYNFIFESSEKVIINADKQKMEQVIYNLISNAINYTGEDKKVTVKIIELERSYRVEIIDTGKGIDKKDIDKIWDKYYKSDKNHKRNNFGTGLGLSIVKSILILHSYKYGVISENKKGTTFYFEIDK